MRNSTTYLHSIPALQARFIRETEHALNGATSVARAQSCAVVEEPAFTTAELAWFRGARS